MVKEAETQRKILSRGHGKKPDWVREKVLDLIAEGKTFSQVSQVEHMPSRGTLWNWQRDDPDFREAVEERFSSYVDELAKEVTPRLKEVFEFRGFQDAILDEAEQLPKLEKLYERDGLYKKLFLSIMQADRKARAWPAVVAHVLNAAARRNESWRENAEGAGNMMVLDVDIDFKATDLPGTESGQSATAIAAGKWKQIRGEAKDA